jgi:NTE family protein
MTMRRILLSSLLTLAAGCAHYPVNPPLKTAPNLATGYRWANTTIPHRTSGTFVVLTFSGGGTRAAGLSYGVLQQLEATKMANGAPLLDSVDVISSVSGGSFASMEYGMRGKEMLKDFPAKFLQVPVQGMLFKAAFLTPRYWIKLLSPSYHRIDLAAEIYDNLLFHDATFETLRSEQEKHDRPLIIANATELEIGAHFEWTQDQFDPICSDLSAIHVARAVAASSAFPILLPALVLDKYDRTVCGYKEPREWLDLSKNDDYTNPSRPRYASELRGYLDPERKFLHLIDGGVSDNIGLRGPYHALISSDTFVPSDGTRTGFTLLPLINGAPGFRRLDRVLVIIVNAGTSGPVKLDKIAQEPSLAKVLGGISGTPMDNYSFDTIQQLVDLASGRSGGRVRYYPVLLNFALIRDESLRKAVNDIGTNFDNLSDAQLASLQKAADVLLHQDPCFQQFLRDSRGEVTPPDAPVCASALPPATP